MEHGRNVLGLDTAEHAEYDPAAPTAFVSKLSCDLTDTTIDVRLRRGSRVRELHDGAALVRERTTCNYGLNPEYQQAVDAAGLRVVGVDGTGEARVVELDGHPYFVATLYLPQFAEEQPHPILAALVTAAMAPRGTSPPPL